MTNRQTDTNHATAIAIGRICALRANFIGTAGAIFELSYVAAAACCVGWGGKSPGEEGATCSSSTGMPTELPFQLQVTYTDLDGARAMRVLTQAQPVTSDRAEAETRACSRLKIRCFDLSL